MIDDSGRTPVVGIVGGGQLARMCYQAAIPLGIELRILAERPDDGAAKIAASVQLGSPTAGNDLLTLAAACDVITFDHELVDVPALEAVVAAGHTIWPSPATMAIAQDKWEQRTRFAAAGLPVPLFAAAPDVAAVAAFGQAHGWPVVLKAARGGYDGRGVWVLTDAAEAAATVPALVARDIPLLVEQWVPIEREIAVLVARRPAGQTAVYPMIETVQQGGICHELAVPAPIDRALAIEAAGLSSAVAAEVGLVGVMALELFVSAGKLVINEIAVRPHNSGHFSIEGSETSQFEQHLRAVLDLPLGSTALTAPAVATVNLLGGPDGSDPQARLPLALAMDGVHVHLYGKQARPGRKLGHVTVRAETAAEARERAWAAAAALTGVTLPPAKES